MSTLLLTGATGSFGQAFVARALAECWYDRIIAFSDTESNQTRMKEVFPPSGRLEYFLGNVRDMDRVRWAMRAGVDLVIHAAAMKEVPTCEYDWPEAVATNVEGSRNVALASVEYGVARALLISTDKAVDAVTEYGKTKSMAESWFVRANRGYSPHSGVMVNIASNQPSRRLHGHCTALGAVRYGNVLSSRASLVPTVTGKISAGAAVPMTDLRMTRFWWTLDAAVNFVHNTLSELGPGQIWVPMVKAAPVIALMQALSGGQTRLDVVGIRGKEKLHESLLAADEARHTYMRRDRNALVVEPAGASWPTHARGDKVPDDFTYRSDDDRLWMTQAALELLLGMEVLHR